MNLRDQLTQLGSRIPQPWQPTGKPRGSATSRVAVVHWDQQTIDFLIVNPKSSTIREADYGRISWIDSANPLQALAEHLRREANMPQRLVVLLSRPELEQLNLTLPPAETSELPVLVAAEVEQQLGETEEPPVVDFYPIAGASPNGGEASHSVMAFSLPRQHLERIKSWSQQAGWRLTAVSSRELAPLGILRRKSVSQDSLNISIHLVADEAELAICRGADPVFLRLIRINAAEPQRLAEQVWMETQRCLTILPDALAELPQAWFVFTTCESAWHVAQSLEDRGSIVQPVDPLIGWEVETHDNNRGAVAPPLASPEAQPAADQTTDQTTEQVNSLASEPAPPTSPEDLAAGSELATVEPTKTEPLVQRVSSAATAGAAWELLHSKLAIDLLAPKQAPTVPHPLRRWGVIIAGGAAVAAVAVYFMLSDISQLKTEVSDMQRELNDAKKVTAKLQEKADQVTFVESWMSEQVDWLSELNELSRRLPDGQAATVRRLTAKANGSVAQVDLSLQVAEQEHIAQLENRIRGAKYQATSQRISQSPDASEYPWQFETHITFPVEPPPRDAYAAVASQATTADDKETP